EVTHRLFRDFFLDLCEEGRSCRRLGVSVHHQDVSLQDEDRRIAVRQSLWLGERCKDPFCHLLDGEQIGIRCPRLDARRAGTKECLFENACPGKHTCKGAAEKIASRMSVMMMAHLSLLGATIRMLVRSAASRRRLRP